MKLLERLKTKGAKRILALDGGGIRGALTLGYLEKIEQILRDKHDNQNLKLCEYFDLIGGTSTGSIIAAALSVGMTVAEVKKMYLDLGETVFTRNRLWKWLKASFSADNLRIELQKAFGDITLGSSEIKTGLCIFAKRADTGSTWVFINHPEGKYYPDNKDILLRRAVRASTAAPTYFEPETIDVGRGQNGAFIDGGVSMVNNPALMLFLMTSLKGFPFHWETGEDKILLVSIGTGTWKLRSDVDSVSGAWLATWASRVPSILMYDASQQNQLLLQFLSNTKTRCEIDSEIGDLSSDLLTEKPLLTYLRYNAFLDENGMNELGLVEMIPKLDSLRDMSAGKNRFDLANIGGKSAERQVLDDHFPNEFNIDK
ncbi:MAG: patatin-like phospholipase family protein [Acidobacteriota bacterium]|nr:patatin-like phospholipase family protein [Acidobacteriota bacterium]